MERIEEYPLELTLRLVQLSNDQIVARELLESSTQFEFASLY